MRMVLDAGALIAIDRAERHIAGLIVLGRRVGADLVTMAPVVAQVWRDGARQVHLVRSLSMIDVMPMDLDTARSAGELLKVTSGSDVVDAAVVLLARPGDQILTSDLGDIDTLLKARRVAATAVRV
jgi:PIN domain nuclease of toxin-antitoxin system